MRNKEELKAAADLAKKTKRKLAESLGMDSGLGTGKMLVGILAGMAAGAALALLFAPDSGRKSRKMIARKGNGYLDEAGEKYVNLIETLASAFDNAKSSVFNTADEVGAKAKDYRNSVAKTEEETLGKYS